MNITFDTVTAGLLEYKNPQYVLIRVNYSVLRKMLRSYDWRIKPVEFLKEANAHYNILHKGVYHELTVEEEMKVAEAIQWVAANFADMEL